MFGDQRLELRGQDQNQGLENVYSRPRTCSSLDLTVMTFEPQTSRYRDERDTARPTRPYRKKHKTF